MTGVHSRGKTEKEPKSTIADYYSGYEGWGIRLSLWSERAFWELDIKHPQYNQKRRTMSGF